MTNQEYTLSKQSFFDLNKIRSFLFVISSLALIAGMILSFISWERICAEECGDVHNYRLFGLPFETFGFIFFPLVIIFHFLSPFYRIFGIFSGFMLASAVGAEASFILVQKYVIGHWCPVCLSLAATIGLAATMYFIDFIIKLKSVIKEGIRSEIMSRYRQSLASLIIIILGFTFAHIGLGKVDQLQAIENSVKDSIAFGDPKSPIEIYIFTDWACPACRQLEPNLVKMIPTLAKEAKITFVDFAIHPETLNYTPYNLSFMINNKVKYLELRDALTKLSLKTGSPSDHDVEDAIATTGAAYHQLNYADVALGIKYFKHLGDEFDIDQTPTMVIINRTTKKGKKLFGGADITEENVQKAIDALSKKH
jgi:protein-disulfide isomerase/uncharacterized membrane protein